MEQERGFGDLRSLLHGEPSAQAWLGLCHLIEQIIERQTPAEQVIPYAQAALSRWPQHLRVLSGEELRRWAGGQAVPALSLIKRVELKDEPVEVIQGLVRHAELLPCAVELRLISQSMRDLSLIALIKSLRAAGRLSELWIDYGGQALIAELGQGLRAQGLGLMPLEQAQLRHANLFEPSLWDMAQIPGLRTLRVLSSQLQESGDRVEVALSPSLEELDLSGTKLNARRLELLGESLGTASALRRLKLSFIKSSAEALGGLLRVERARALTHLSLALNELGPSSMLPFFESEAHWSLKSLELQRNPLGVMGIESVIFSPAATGLEHLDLSKTRAGAQGAHALASCERLDELKALSFGDNHIQDSGAASLSLASWTQQLERLNLRYNKISARGFEALSAPGRLTVLESLDLSYNPIGAESLLGLEDERRLPSLRQLILDESQIQAIKQAQTREGRVASLLRMQ